MAMIEIKNVTIKYGNHIALSSFSAHIEKNNITAIIGSNGSGKSSLLSAISGDLELADGEIYINDFFVPELTDEEMAYLRSYAQQSHHYWMAYSVDEILRMGHDRVSSERFNYICDALDITDFLHQKITELSGGQLQRVEVARAFMRDTTLVLLDEPFASQDVQSISRMIELFESEKKRGVTLVIVAHSPREELSWCDDVISLSQ